jgi:hypothetical protein
MTDDETDTNGEQETDSTDTEHLRAKVDRLESLVDHQQETIEQLQTKVEAASDDGWTPGATRRGVLTAGGALAALGLGAGTASADPSGQIGTSSDPLQKLYTAELNGGVTNDKSLTDIEGSGLSINSGTLDASGASSWTDGDAADLLEPSAGGKVGVEVDKIADDGSGSVSLQSPLDAGGTDVTDTSGDLTLTSGANNVALGATLDTSGNTVTNTSGDVTVGSALDLDGNALKSSSGAFSVTTGSGNLTLNPSGDIDANSNNLNNVASIDNGGSAISVSDRLNLSNSDPIQDNGTDAIQFDGAQNVSVASGDFTVTPSGNSATTLDVQNASGSSVLTADTASDEVVITETTNNDTLTLKHDDTDGVVSTSTGDLKLNPSGNVTVSGNVQISSPGSGSSSDNVLAIDGSGNVQKASSKTLSDVGGIGSSISVDDISDDGSGQVTMGSPLDLAGNNITSSTGAFSVTTGSGNLTLNPSGDIDANSNNLNNVASIDNGGSAISVDDAVNLSNSDSIQDNGTDAIQFDGSQNLIVANGDLDLSNGAKMSLPTVTSDPSANAGDMWYRSDLD